MGHGGDSIADREPCPWRIIDDVGGAFSMGAIGGGVFHSVKGSFNAPSGARLKGSINAVSARGPILGGQFAVWGGLFACCDCTLTSIRGKEDPWNSIISGAATGGTLAIRAGPKAAASAAVVGGVLLALIEGMGIMVTKMMSPQLPGPEELAAMGAIDPTAPPTSGGLMGTGSGMSSSAPPPPTEPLSPNVADGEGGSGGSDGANPFAVLAGGGGSSGGDFGTYGSATTFSSESSEGKGSSGGGGWWPFGGKS